MRASVSRFEIPVRDAARAARFYGEVFGWAVERVEWEGPAYFRLGAAVEDAAAPARRGIDGGLVTGGEVGDQPLLVVHVDGASLEECLARIVAAGGAVEAAVVAVGVRGRFARFLDSEGNRLGLWQAV